MAHRNPYNKTMKQLTEHPAEPVATESSPHWENLPMSDRYKFSYDKLWGETSEEMKLLIGGVDERPCFKRGDCKSRAQDFAHKVALFAEKELDLRLKKKLDIQREISIIEA